MKKKGFTIVELILSFGLALLIMTFLFQILLTLKEVYFNSGVKSELLTKQAILAQKMGDTFSNKVLKATSSCGDRCMIFTFSDNTTAKLMANLEENLITFGDYTTKLPEGCSFGMLDVTNDSTVGVDTDIVNSYLKVKVEIFHKLLEGDYGVTIVTPYDSRKITIPDIAFSVANRATVTLKGDADMVMFTDGTYTEPGWSVKKSDGTTSNNDASVKVIGEVGKEANRIYTLEYRYYDANGNVSGMATRKVRVIPRAKEFAYTGNYTTFTVPITGEYKIELWGSQGGSSMLDGGTRVFTATGCIKGYCYGGAGAYTSGNITLQKGEQLHFYVGSMGGTPTKGETTAGGYNGGGAGDHDHADDEVDGSGGGATDVRLVAGLWDDITSLRSRIMVAAGGGGASDQVTGSPAGGLTSVATTSSAGATQKTGFAFGKGQDGISVRTNYPVSGGGGGYYGGIAKDSGNSFNNRASGGSSFISGHTGCDAINTAGVHTGQVNHFSGKKFTNTVMKSGADALPTITGSGTETGHTGNGYAKISFVR